MLQARPLEASGGLQLVVSQAALETNASAYQSFLVDVVHSFRASPWQRCAEAGGTCSCPSGLVRMGDGSSYLYAESTEAVCSLEWFRRKFGDKLGNDAGTNPARDFSDADAVRLACECSTQGPDVAWPQCATYNGDCRCVHGVVRLCYLAQCNYRTMAAADEGIVDCSNTNFGDPAPGRSSKRCYCLAEGYPMSAVNFTEEVANLPVSGAVEGTVRDIRFYPTLTPSQIEQAIVRFSDHGLVMDFVMNVALSMDLDVRFESNNFLDGTTLCSQAGFLRFDLRAVLNLPLVAVGGVLSLDADNFTSDFEFPSGYDFQICNGNGFVQAAVRWYLKRELGRQAPALMKEQVELMAATVSAPEAFTTNNITFTYRVYGQPIFVADTMGALPGPRPTILISRHERASKRESEPRMNGHERTKRTK